MEKDNKLLLNHVRFVLEEGQPEKARELLERICPENEEQQREIAYLRAWSYIQDKSWDEAEHTLTPLVRFIERAMEEETGEQNIYDRQRRALCLFYLGKAAVNLGHFEDAAHHYDRCLKLLQNRRVQAPKLQPIRIRVRYSLGMTCIERGLYPAARQYYEDALSLYEEVCKDSSEDLREDLAAIYYGLCDLYRKTGKLFDALEVGTKALDIYDEMDNLIMESRMHNLIGHIYMRLNEFRDASDHFTDALAIATSCDQPKLIMINYLALANLRMAEERLKEAMDYCGFALGFISRFKDDLLSGMAYLDAGKVARAEADQLQGEQMRLRMEDALHYFEQACDYLDKTQAYDKIAGAHGACAEILETLGRTQEALANWNSAYKAHANSFGPSFF